VTGILLGVQTDEEWFNALDVFYEEADGWVWANLRRRSNPSAVVPRYGRGRSRDQSLASPNRRYEVEQIG
jgi:hypothetical protein